MVALTELARASALQGEKDIVARALTNFDAGGTIINMTIGPDAVTVDTSDISYPFQMTEAIKAALTARQEAIEKQLSDLGVSGVGSSEQTPGPLGAAGLSRR